MTDEEFISVIDNAFKSFNGDSSELESAIGTLAISRHLGWKPVFLIHQRVTIKKYETILGISFREVVPEIGPAASRSVSWKLAEKLSNFWKAVRGEIPGIKSPAIE